MRTLLAAGLLCLSACGPEPPEGVRVFAGGDSAAVRTTALALAEPGDALLSPNPPARDQVGWLTDNGFAAGVFVSDVPISDTLGATLMRVPIPGELRYGKR